MIGEAALSTMRTKIGVRVTTTRMGRTSQLAARFSIKRTRKRKMQTFNFRTRRLAHRM